MKVLHLFKSPPDETIQTLAAAWNDGAADTASVHLYEGPLDYEALVDLIFESDQVLTWP
ncbi:MAG: hypothetical protein AB1896_13925 [Thermodesulfobacteriota bacterium]